MNPDSQQTGNTVLTFITQNGLNQGCPNFLWQNVTPIIVGWPVIMQNGHGCPNFYGKRPRL